VGASGRGLRPDQAGGLVRHQHRDPIDRRLLRRIVLIASKAGAERHPAWYHNLIAHPEVGFTGHDGRHGRFRAREAQGPERDALWALANDLYAGYEDYQQRTGGRRIPVIVLELNRA
jgi:deazaflavin-dependent oxidoreductase (nitroreductase family)